jgi:hypothetical protein
MSDAPAVWPRPYFKPGPERTCIDFMCFGKAPLAELPLGRSRFAVPETELLAKLDFREHHRKTSKQWFEGWWAGPFGMIAHQDLGSDLGLLTTSDTCVSLRLDLEDCPDLAPIQLVWAVTRWLCARGISVVLDVHAFRFRTRETLEQLSFGEPDISRELKLVLETDATRDGLHLFHTRGLCKFARPELVCFVTPDDAAVLAHTLNQIGRTLMEGASPEQIRLRLGEGLEVTTTPASDQPLIDSLGIKSAVRLVRADGAPLAGISRLIAAP